MSVPKISGWAFRDRHSRALAILDWCVDNDVETASIMGYHLAAAMEEAERQIAEETSVEHESSPADYVHLVRVLAAFLRSRI